MAALCGKQPIQAVVQAVGVNLLHGHAQEVLQGRAAIPRRFDVQFAGGLAEAGDRSKWRPPPAKGPLPDLAAPGSPAACPAPIVATTPAPSKRRRSRAAAPGESPLSFTSTGSSSARIVVVRRIEQAKGKAAPCRRDCVPTGPSRFARCGRIRRGRPRPVAAIRRSVRTDSTRAQ